LYPQSAQSSPQKADGRNLDPEKKKASEKKSGDMITMVLSCVAAVVTITFLIALINIYNSV
jgi:hypothetical protein